MSTKAYIDSATAAIVQPILDSRDERIAELEQQLAELGESRDNHVILHQAEQEWRVKAETELVNLLAVILRDGGHYQADWTVKAVEEAKATVFRERAELAALREALERLARLGNGDKYGNSEGNVIAQDALKAQLAELREDFLAVGEVREHNGSLMVIGSLHPNIELDALPVGAKVYIKQGEQR